jgi:hypothetical protein
MSWFSGKCFAGAVWRCGSPAVRYRFWFHAWWSSSASRDDMQQGLSEIYPGRWIGSWVSIAWPPWSPDLTLVGDTWRSMFMNCEMPMVWLFDSFCHLMATCILKIKWHKTCVCTIVLTFFLARTHTGELLCEFYFSLHIDGDSNFRI